MYRLGTISSENTTGGLNRFRGAQPHSCPFITPLDEQCKINDIPVRLLHNVSDGKNSCKMHVKLRHIKGKTFAGSANHQCTRWLIWSQSNCREAIKGTTERAKYEHPTSSFRFRLWEVVIIEYYDLPVIAQAKREAWWPTVKGLTTKHAVRCNIVGS